MTQVSTRPIKDIADRMPTNVRERILKLPDEISSQYLIEKLGVWLELLEIKEENLPAP